MIENGPNFRDIEDLNQKATKTVDRLSREFDGYHSVVFIVNPYTNNWAVGVSRDMMDPKNFVLVANAGNTILSKMITRN